MTASSETTAHSIIATNLELSFNLNTRKECSGIETSPAPARSRRRDFKFAFGSVVAHQSTGRRRQGDRMVALFAAQQ
jgi:hypothetical protein